MASVNEENAEVRFSDDNGASIIVTAIFSGVTKDSLDVYPKTLMLRNMRIPLHRFGAWVFELSKNPDEEREIARKMGPIASFIWALRQSYPEISVWVDDPSKCSFVLEFEKDKQKHYLNEIPSLRVKLQEQLKKIGDLTLRFIKITPDKSTSSKVVALPSKEHAAGAVGGSHSAKAINDPTADSQPSTEAVWKCKKLKGDIESEKDPVQKLLLQTELALFLYDLGKTDDVSVLTDEIKRAIPEIEPSKEKNAEISKNLRELSNLYENDDKLIESTEILFYSIALVHNFDDQDDRLYHINTDAVKICELLAKMYKVKPTCIRASVGEDDEIGRPRQGRRSRTSYSQARWLERRGNQALEQFKFDEALSSFSSAVQLQPKEAHYRLDKADVYLAKGQLKSCKNECEKALKLDISSVAKARALELLGEIEYRSYRVLEAFGLFQKAKTNRETTSISSKISRLEEAFKISRGDSGRQVVIHTVFVPTPVFPFLNFDEFDDDYY